MAAVTMIATQTITRSISATTLPDAGTDTLLGAERVHVVVRVMTVLRYEMLGAS
jgi:hypothetical protein